MKVNQKNEAWQTHAFWILAIKNDQTDQIFHHYTKHNCKIFKKKKQISYYSHQNLRLGADIVTEYLNTWKNRKYKIRIVILKAKLSIRNINRWEALLVLELFNKEANKRKTCYLSSNCKNHYITNQQFSINCWNKLLEHYTDSLKVRQLLSGKKQTTCKMVSNVHGTSHGLSILPRTAAAAWKQQYNEA